MKERSILFSGPMVRGILEGRKTQTRRVLKKALSPLGNEWADNVTSLVPGRVIAHWGPHSASDSAAFAKEHYAPEEGIPCPYGVPGDRMWVRERWQTTASVDDLSPTKIGQKALDAGYPHPWAPIWYCDGVYNNAIPERETRPDCGNWGGRSMKLRPSIHMPRWASRITLEVTDVRVERVQDISEEDCDAEGVQNTAGDATWRLGGGHGKGSWWSSPLEAFEKGWDSINAKRGYPWASNPWVWVVTFRKLDA